MNDCFETASPAVIFYCCFTLELETKELMCHSSVVHHILTLMIFSSLYIYEIQKRRYGISMSKMILKFRLLDK